MTNEEKLRKALCRIKTGSFDNASTMAINGDWKAMYRALQNIASDVLVETLCPSPSPAQKDDALLEWDDAPRVLRAAVLRRVWSLAGEEIPDISHYWRAIKEIANSEGMPVNMRLVQALKDLKQAGAEEILLNGAGFTAAYLTAETKASEAIAAATERAQDKVERT